MTKHLAATRQHSHHTSLVPRLHHIGVQTTDMENCVSWYRDFFGGRSTWSLDTFSELTHSRLPGMVQLTEIVLGDLRVHLFERKDPDDRTPGGNVVQFQHVCLATDSPEDLRTWREWWIELYDSGRHTFALSEQPTEIVTDADGVQSCYVLDVNGLEYEFTYIPDGVS